MTVWDVFRNCVEAVRNKVLIKKESKKDKEFHFQNWFADRLESLKLEYLPPARNSYPDFRLKNFAEGYEIKGLADPGRDVNFDSNSQVPAGLHNSRQIFYVFGRYPKDPEGTSFPLLDLVICHGSFLNSDHLYVHKNKSIRGFGSYGDIMIRDRKMYVVPTPFHLVNKVERNQTLILPAADEAPSGSGYTMVGELSRVEAAEFITSYSFNLRNNDLVPKKVSNAEVGTTHKFRAWRLAGSKMDAVSMQVTDPSKLKLEVEDDNGEE